MELVKQAQAAHEDLGVLAVLEAVAGDARLSQRELARRTGLNLKKVNYCLRRLLEKGHVKFQRALDHPDKRAYLYVLTPAGLRARTRLTYRFVRLTLAFYEELEARVKQRLGELAQVGVRRLVLLGWGEVARIVLDQASGLGVQVVGVVGERAGSDGGPGGCGEGVSSVPMLADLSGVAWDGVLVTEGGDAVEAELARLGVTEERVWTLA